MCREIIHCVFAGCSGAGILSIVFASCSGVGILSIVFAGCGYVENIYILFIGYGCVGKVYIVFAGCSGAGILFIVFCRLWICWKHLHCGFFAGCGGVRNASVDGEIFSKNYPQNYPPNSNCTWLITSSVNSEWIGGCGRNMQAAATSNHACGMVGYSLWYSGVKPVVDQGTACGTVGYSLWYSRVQPVVQWGTKNKCL